MRNSTKGFISAIVFIVGLSSCQTFPDTVVPELSKRTLRIASDFAGFTYSYCKTMRPNCREKDWVVQKFDMTDVATREKLKNMNFVLVVEKSPF